MVEHIAKTVKDCSTRLEKQESKKGKPIHLSHKK